MKVVFTTKIKIEGNNTGIEVPSEVMAHLGTSKKPPVIITVAGYTYRSTVAVMGGLFMVPLSKAHREATGINGGDEVEITIEADEEPRTVAIPTDLAAALIEHVGAKESFEALAYSKRKEFVRQVEEAKSPETRTRRIAGIIAKLGTP
jgi:bifunctional DNA-binding transcriptional regulator/antitoxin component of YhaV-PrlF toxin-antitoxin module